jgi:hypothetical protein
VTALSCSSKLSLPVFAGRRSGRLFVSESDKPHKGVMVNPQAAVDKPPVGGR